MKASQKIVLDEIAHNLIVIVYNLNIEENRDRFHPYYKSNKEILSPKSLTLLSVTLSQVTLSSLQ